MKKIPFTHEAQKTQLTSKEREDLRARLISYMEYHPLSMPVPRTRATGARSLVRIFGVRVTRLRPLVGAAAVLFFIVVPVAAEQSLPGDALYPVKVRVTEGVRSQLTFSPYEKMQWETERVERRIAEARLLAQEGKLTKETENALSATVRQHTAAFKAQLDELRAQDADGAEIAEVTFESALDVQSAVLDTETQRQALSTTIDQQGDVAGIAATVRAVRSEVADAVQASSTTSYARLMARTEENTTRIHALHESLAPTLTEEQRADIDTRIAQVNERLMVARELHEAGEEEEALAQLREVLATTQKLIAFMSSIDLRAQISLESLVPAEVPNEALYQALAQLREQEAVLDARIVAHVIPDTDIEVMHGSLSSLLTTIDTHLAEGEWAEAQLRLVEAEALAHDIAEALAEIAEANDAPQTSTSTDAVQE